MLEVSKYRSILTRDCILQMNIQPLLNFGRQLAENVEGFAYLAAQPPLKVKTKASSLNQFLDQPASQSSSQVFNDSGLLSVSLTIILKERRKRIKECISAFSRADLEEALWIMILRHV